MFTGLVQQTGRLLAVERAAQGGWSLSVRHGPWEEGPLETGESVAVQGVCLTVRPVAPDRFVADLLDETLDHTAFRNLAPEALVNLERALRPCDRLGGHFVTGHVDETGTLSSLVRRGRDTVFRVSCSARLSRQTVLKGSIALDGVSLTVSALGDDFFEVNLIPHTLAATSLRERRPGDRLNLESDLLGKYVGRMLGAPRGEGGLTMEKLLQAGFGWSAP
ncbi:MAG: riboflavin synthase [Kiritimatiellia bacterium]|jgi:riboflavin synthase